MEIQSKTTKFILCIIVNIILISILYTIPINSNILENLCIYKLIFGKECWNCGMTRAFLSVIHLNFNKALMYNNKVVLIFPLTIVIYFFSWYKYIVGKNMREQN